MQLFEELPAFVAMFLCALLGYKFVEWLKRSAAASAQHKQKLEGLCQTSVKCTTAGAATTMNPSNLAACEETTKVLNRRQPNPGIERFQKRKAARRACKAIHPLATRDKLSVAYDINMDSSEGSTAVNLDVQNVAETVPPAGTTVACKPPPLVMLAELAAGSVQEHGNAPADDGRASRWEGMTTNINDAEADDEAESEAAFATNIQKTSGGNHKQPQGWCVDAERLCQQPLLNREQELQIQGDSTEESQYLMVYGMSEVGQHVEEQEELLQAAPADKEQCCFREPELGEWAETTDVGSMNAHSSQSQLDDDRLSREEELRRVLVGDWADASDEEDLSESVYEGMHHSCLRALDSSASQHGVVDHDSWSTSFANDLTPTPQSISSWSRKWKQGSQLYKDNLMTSSAPADGEMPDWFTDDKWFGQGQWDNRWQKSDDDGGSTGWFSEKQWCNDQGSNHRPAENDCWMTPFDELFQRTRARVIDASEGSITSSRSSSIEPAVCIWNAGNPASEAFGDSSEGNGTAEIFTDGQRVFQPVPSATGQPLFTDGKQIYASVCVIVGPPGEAVDPIFATARGAAMCGSSAADLSSSLCSTISLMADWSDDDEPSFAVIGGAED